MAKRDNKAASGERSATRRPLASQFHGWSAAPHDGSRRQLNQACWPCTKMTMTTVGHLISPLHQGLLARIITWRSRVSDCLTVWVAIKRPSIHSVILPPKTGTKLALTKTPTPAAVVSAARSQAPRQAQSTPTPDFTNDTGNIFTKLRSRRPIFGNLPETGFRPALEPVNTPAQWTEEQRFLHVYHGGRDPIMTAMGLSS